MSITIKEISTKRKLQRYATIADKKEVGILEEFDAVDTRIDAVESTANEALTIVKQVQKMEGPEGPKPTEEDLLELIAPLIPDAIPGPAYTMTAEDMTMIAGLVTVPAVDRVIETIVERTEVIKEQPVTTEVVKEKAMYESAEAIVQKINSLKEVIDLETLKGWKDIYDRIKLALFNPTMGPSFADLEVLRKAIAAISTGSSSSNSIYGETPVGSGTAFTIAHMPVTGTVRLFRGGARQKLGEDYSISGASITFFASVSVGETLLADYNY